MQSVSSDWFAKMSGDADIGLSSDCVPWSSVLARILKVNLIFFEREPIKKLMLELKLSSVRATTSGIQGPVLRQLVGSRGITLVRVQDRVLRSSGVLPILNEYSEVLVFYLFWMSCKSFPGPSCIFMINKHRLCGKLVKFMYGFKISCLFTNFVLILLHHDAITNLYTF